MFLKLNHTPTLFSPLLCVPLKLSSPLFIWLEEPNPISVWFQSIRQLLRIYFATSPTLHYDDSNPTTIFSYLHKPNNSYLCCIYLQHPAFNFWIWAEKMGSFREVLTHPDELYALSKLSWYCWFIPNFFTVLPKLSWSFALLISQLGPELRKAVSVNGIGTPTESHQFVAFATYIFPFSFNGSFSCFAGMCILFGSPSPWYCWFVPNFFNVIYSRSCQLYMYNFTSIPVLALDVRVDVFTVVTSSDAFVIEVANQLM